VLRASCRWSHSETATRAAGSHAAFPHWSINKLLKQALDNSANFRPSIDCLGKQAPVTANDESLILGVGLGQSAEIVEEAHRRADTSLERTIGAWALRGQTSTDLPHQAIEASSRQLLAERAQEMGQYRSVCVRKQILAARRQLVQCCGTCASTLLASFSNESEPYEGGNMPPNRVVRDTELFRHFVRRQSGPSQDIDDPSARVSQLL
jgi:hypothetical protein